ncbi:urease accessory protein UreD [Falsirhodobacter sp. 20TX0035]|uniref:urease accessory protein UreD n=1 Tax=Falsirhodobacter sp. 20TX0035 TaxID=3022019 RepID=UPI00232DAC83|nr:urease accessory protein UreD [Falsirhodobacter sp. 20TX0035]MDB6454498.1 urease accessory protein UreD [Falsirhodobacter sp. 20TX0035]
MERSAGKAHAALTLRDGRMRLTALRQQGSAKAILPRVEGPPEVVFLNTSGGLTGGDRLEMSLDVTGRAIATTQTAERAYDAGGGVATVRVSHRVDGWLDWLPQETILYDRARVDRITRIDLAPDAGCLMLEMLVLGRAAMGETVRDLHLSDRREVWRGEKPVLLEWLRLDKAALCAGPAGLAGSRAIATLAMVGPGAEDALDPARAALGVGGVEAAASAFGGKMVVRMRAGDGWLLRRQVARLLLALRREPLPRVWQI